MTSVLIYELVLNSRQQGTPVSLKVCTVARPCIGRIGLTGYFLSLL